MTYSLTQHSKPHRTLGRCERLLAVLSRTEWQASPTLTARSGIRDPTTALAALVRDGLAVERVSPEHSARKEWRRA